MRVFVTRQLTDGAASAMGDLPASVEVFEGGGAPDRSELLEGARGAAALLTMVTDEVDEAVLDAAGDDLRIVANHAVGVDNIDLAAAAERGVVVTHTPGVLDEAVADLTFGLVLATSRRIGEADRMVRSGTPWVWGPRVLIGLDLSAGATLGIVGLGRIGMAVARRARAFGMRILATGSRASSAEARDLGVEPADLGALLDASDVVSLHCPLTDSTRHLIGAAELRRMRPGAILINTARGRVVDEAALVAALGDGTIAAAGLDVFEHEPQVHPGLLKLDNVVLAPHIGSAGEATRDRMGQLAIDNIAAVLTGKDPLTPVSA